MLNLGCPLCREVGGADTECRLWSADVGRRQAGHRTQQKGPSEGVGAWGVAEGQVSAHLFPGPDTHVPEPCHPPWAPPEGGLDVTSPGSRCPTAQIQPDFTVSSATWLFFLPPDVTIPLLGNYRKAQSREQGYTWVCSPTAPRDKTSNT